MDAVRVEPLVLNLMETIDAEVRVFQQLLDNLLIEQQALMRHEPQSLGAAVETQQALTKQASQLEAKRASVVARLSKAIGEDGVSLTLRLLIDKVQGPHADRLREMRQTLLDLQAKIQRANRHNALLINQSLKYVDKSLSLLTGGGRSGLYGASGKSTGGAVSQSFVDQVA